VIEKVVGLIAESAISFFRAELPSSRGGLLCSVLWRRSSSELLSSSRNSSKP